jgi:2-hydroxycyclohexanecarboxyl-CoA dehydrogenase
MNLNGKVALVAGAASGIGLAAAQALARAGAHVVLGDINVESGEKSASEIRAQGLQAEFAKLDVTSDTAIAGLREVVERKHSSLDILVNSAGWSSIELFVNSKPELWQRLIDLNYVGTLKVIHSFLPAMIQKTGCKIVNVSSDAARAGSPGEAVYSGAKAAVVAFTKALAREVARYSINVNCVCPGPTDTPLLASVPEKHRETLLRVIPFRRFAKPSEVADAILFFASPSADYVTGQVLSVSGGLTMVD